MKEKLETALTNDSNTFERIESIIGQFAAETGATEEDATIAGFTRENFLDKLEALRDGTAEEEPATTESTDGSSTDGSGTAAVTTE